MDPSAPSPLHFERRGQGDPLLLLHGIGLQWQVWLPVLDRLAAECDVIAVDLPGFGLSPPLTRPSIGALTDSLVALLDRLELGRPDVAGNSLGGWLALELARRRRARSVVALSPAGFWSRREAAYVRASLLMTHALAGRLAGHAEVVYSSALGRTLLGGQVFARPWRVGPEDGVRTIRNLAAAPGFLATMELMTADHYRVGPAPAAGEHSDPADITIAWGARDRLLFPRQARRAARALPQARILMLPGVGHVPFSDDPELVARTLLEARQAAGLSATRRAAVEH